MSIQAQSNVDRVFYVDVEPITGFTRQIEKATTMYLYLTPQMLYPFPDLDPF